MTEVPPLLAVRDMSAGYGKVAVIHHVALHVHRGESVALLGSNNAGKSTVLRCLSGLLALSAGSIVFEDLDVTLASPSQRVDAGIIQVPEGRHIFADLTVEDNLRVGASRLPRQDRRAQVDSVYERLSALTQYRGKRAGALSGGQQQMVAIGRALAARPRLLLVDEPSLGLSPVAVDGVVDTLRELQHEELTMLVVEQSAQLASQLCRRGYVLSDGRIVVDGDFEDLDPDRLREAYLS